MTVRKPFRAFTDDERAALRASLAQNCIRCNPLPRNSTSTIEELVYARQHYQDNRDERLARQKQYYWDNREVRLAYQNAYNARKRAK